MAARATAPTPECSPSASLPRECRSPPSSANTSTAEDQLRPAVGVDDDGDFVVAWQSYGQDGSDWGVFARRFNSSGNAQGGELAVNATTSSAQQYPALAMSDNGSFVVAWQHQVGGTTDIRARRFDAAGVSTGVELSVNTYVTESQSHPAIAASSGGFVVAWTSLGQDGEGFGVFGRRFDTAGVGRESSSRSVSRRSSRRPAPTSSWRPPGASS